MVGSLRNGYSPRYCPSSGSSLFCANPTEANKIAVKRVFRYLTTKPITIKEDNQGAIAMTQNPIAHSRTKHIDICFHFVREAREEV